MHYAALLAFITSAAHVSRPSIARAAFVAGITPTFGIGFPCFIIRRHRTACILTGNTWTVRGVGSIGVRDGFACTACRSAVTRWWRAARIIFPGVPFFSAAFELRVTAFISRLATVEHWVTYAILVLSEGVTVTPKVAAFNIRIAWTVTVGLVGVPTAAIFTGVAALIKKDLTPRKRFNCVWLAI